MLAVKDNWRSSVEQSDDGKPQSIIVDWTRDDCSEKKSCSVLSKLRFSSCADIESQRVVLNPGVRQKQLGIVCKELSDLVWREKKERRTRTSETTSQHRDDNLVQDFNLLLLPLCLRLITPGWWWLPVWCPSSSSSLLCPPSCPAPNLPAAKSASLIEDWRCVSIWICLHKPEVNYYH